MVEMTVRGSSEGLRCHERATWKSGGGMACRRGKKVLLR